MPAESQCRFSVISLRRDKLSKLTLAISVAASFVLATIILYVCYSSIRYGCVKNGNCHLPVSYSKEKYTRNCRETCMTKDCVHAANSIMEKLDTSVDPCVDFYRFSCGNWLKKFGKRDNVSVMEEVETTMKLAIKEVLDAVQPIPGTAVHKLKTVYDSCMSKTAAELNAVPSALKVLESLGIPNWPLLDADFTFSDVSLEESIARMATFDLYTFFQPSPDVGDDDSTWNIGNRTDRTQPMNLTLMMRYTKTSDEHYVTMKEISLRTLSYFGIEAEEANETVTEFLDFSKELHKLREAKNEDIDKCAENKTNCHEGNTPSYLSCSHEVNESLRFVCDVVAHYLKLTDLEGSYSTDYIKLNDNMHFQGLFGVLRNHSDRVIANHIALTFFADNLQYLSFYFNRLMRKYYGEIPENRKLWGVRWKYCVDWVSKSMAPALTGAYAPQMLPDSARQEIKETFELVKGEILLGYGENAWLDDNVKEYLNKSLSKVFLFTEVYLNYTLDEDHVNTFYQHFHPSNDSYLMNILEYKRSKYLYMMDNLMAYEHNMFEYNPFVVNAYALPMESRLDLLFGILLPPIYVHGRPRSLNLASLGMFIGHEFGHEIDQLITDFDNPTFMSIFKEFGASYNNRKKCLVDQYERYQMDQIGKNVGGNLTFHENFADYFGMILGEHARQRFISKLEQPELPLPVPYTEDEVFYIAFSQMWCNVKSDESVAEHLEHDTHSPYEIRVMGTLSNSLKFSEVFECPLGSPMNPTTKCNFHV